MHALNVPPRSTFYRVWAFLILEFHFMAVMLWGWDATKVYGRLVLCR